MKKKVRSWTPHQEDAIRARGVSLAVSAAAGSGKTAVLTQRILSLLSEEGGIEASRLAVVTFTKAAAGELEDRLYGALSEKAAEERENRHLTRQLFGLSRAKISTIHSFCYSLVREYHKELGLSDKIRIISPGEAARLEEKAANAVIRSFCRFALDGSKEREEIFRLFGDGKSKHSLVSLIDKIVKAAAHCPGGIRHFQKKNEALLAAAEEMEKGLPFSETPFGEEIQKELFGVLEGSIAVLDYILEELAGGIGEVATAYNFFLFKKREAIKLALDALKKGNRVFAALVLHEHFDRCSVPSLPRKLSDPENKAICHQPFNLLVKDPIKALIPLLEESEEETREDLIRAHQIIFSILSLAEDYETEFTRLKRELDVVDYNDLEHLALSLVMEEKEGEWGKTPLADEIGSRFDALFVDEYQDTNLVQDMLFRAIAGKGKLFVVGDPKQSIYRFRGAEPSIFSSYKATLPEYPSEEGEMQKIFLSNNFRCDKPVVELVNRLFRSIMDENDPNSLYRKEDHLVFSKEREEDRVSPPAEFVLVKKSDRETTEEKDEEDPEEIEEAAYLAGRIGQMLTEERKPGLLYCPEDFAVICRTHRQIARVKEALDRRSIPCNTEKGRSIKEDEEYLFVTSLLDALDNPMQDVPLLGALLSPVFRFTPDELYRIRKGRKDVPFYTALVSYSQKGSHPATCEKCRETAETLRFLREKKRETAIFPFLFFLYGKWGIDLIFPQGEGETRGGVRSVLLAQAERADGAGIATLGAFCRYLEATELPNPDEGRGVTLCTIHKSKGLEFPVVFASFLGANYSLDDEKSTLLLSTDLGGGVYLPEREGRAKRNTLLRRAVKLRLHRDMVEEEKRILYVATTRAAEKLILTASPAKSGNVWDKVLATGKAPLSEELSRYLYAQSKNSMTTALLALRESPAFAALSRGEAEARDGDLILRVAEAIPPKSYVPPVKERTEDAESEEKAKKVLEKVRFAYRERGERELPKKLSVSQILAEERMEEAPEFFPRRLMDFENGRLRTSREAIGTATHKVMQFADFEAMKTDSEGEFARLVARGFLSQEEMAMVEKDKVLAFFDSPLYRQMATSQNVEHEKRWAVLLPADLLGEGIQGEVLVQGVVDAWFENPDGTLTLLDFKTDRVKPENGEELLRQRHAHQLRLYAMAVEKMTGKAVSRLLLYSFSLSRAVEVPLA